MSVTMNEVARRAFLAVPLSAAVAAGAAACGFGGSSSPESDETNVPDGPTGSNGSSGSPASGGQSAAAKGGLTDTLRQANRPANHLNPAFTGGGNGATVLISMMWEGLVRRDPTNSANYLPGAAEKWDISDDGLTYTFHLRSGAKWTNGDPLTADDFVWSYQYYYSPDLAKQGNQYPVSHNGAATATTIKGMADYFSGKTKDFSTVGVKAADPQTLVFTLTAADYRFLDSAVRLSFASKERRGPPQGLLAARQLCR
jgi:ABC-type transport system substrate-binding protein